MNLLSFTSTSRQSKEGFPAQLVSSYSKPNLNHTKTPGSTSGSLPQVINSSPGGIKILVVITSMKLYIFVAEEFMKKDSVKQSQTLSRRHFVRLVAATA